MSLTITDKRSKDNNTFPDIIAKNHLCHLILSIFHHLLARHIAICRTSTSKEQAEIVIHLGRCADRGTRISVCGLLFNTDNRRKARNLIHIRTLHPTKEIAGVCRESLDISSLSLCKDSIKGKRRFSRTRKSGDNAQRITWNLNINILEIVHSGTINFYHDSLCFRDKQILPVT